MGMKQFTFCDACRTEVEGGTAPGTWVRVTYQKQGGETTGTLLCDRCFQLLVDTHAQIAGGKTPDIAQIPALKNALAMAKQEVGAGDSLIRSLQKRIGGQVDEIRTLSERCLHRDSQIRDLESQRDRLLEEVDRLGKKLKRRRR